MQRGFLVESLQKAIFTECYVCIFQTDCCRRRGAQEGSRHDWNESQARVGRMKPNTIQAGSEKVQSFIQSVPVFVVGAVVFLLREPNCSFDTFLKLRTRRKLTIQEKVVAKNSNKNDSGLNYLNS